MKSLSLLIKPASGNCQLRCRYCFYGDITQARQSGERGLMAPSTLDRLTRKAIAETTRDCSFAFQGGEPTLAGLDFFREALRLQKQYRAAYGKEELRIHNALQTNGLLLDEEWCAFFAQNKFLIGLSLDGDRELHDLHRVDAASKGSYSRVMRAARLLKKHGVEFNILIVVTRQLARHARRVYRALVEQGFRYLQFIPCIDDFGQRPGESPFSLTAERYGRFLIELFDEWYRDLAAGRYISIRHFDNWIHMLQGRPPETCSMGGRCVCYGVVESDGSVYPCDFYALDAWRLGSINERSYAELFSTPRAEEFVRLSLALDARCQSCPYYPICRGGCRRDREVPQADGGSVLGLNRYCAGLSRFFEHALDKMLHVARQLR